MIRSDRLGRHACRQGIRLVTVSLIVGFLLSACSSAPPTPDRILDRQNRAAQLAQYGNNHFMRGQYQQALQFFDLSLRENQSVDHLPGIARSLNSVGRVYLATDRYDLARSHFDDALSMARRHEFQLLIVQSLTNLGELALRIDDPVNARLRFEEGLNLLQSDSRSVEAAILTHNLAGLEVREGNLGEARLLVGRALEMNSRVPRYEEMAANYFLLARIDSREGNHSQALAHARLALANDKRMENSPGIAQDLAAIGEILLTLRQPDEAEDYLRRARDVYDAIGLPTRAAATLARLETVATQRGDESSAQRYRDERIRRESR